MSRLQYRCAIYHLMTHGDGRRSLFHNDRHDVPFTRSLALREVAAVRDQKASKRKNESRIPSLTPDHFARPT